jgi:hypothetical protein
MNEIKFNKIKKTTRSFLTNNTDYLNNIILPIIRRDKFCKIIIEVYIIANKILN